ncbi:PAS domain-containing protein [Massilia sp. CCM 8695]|uniref:protein-glutamate O-methyltransferase n=1 Tax=Massilia frigida TaxID=2609281 RepID=A0ABX0NAL4_9BURK|nr:chemotaxis protein CheB [Massilia frigida]NHZ79642.1 PAS domain-containing protein [Massilia frigida]
MKKTSTTPRKQASQSGTAPAHAFDTRPAATAIVGIGASAGGLEALELFLSGVPAASGMAFIVVQHLDPEHKAMMVELLQRGTTLPVVEISDRLRVEPNHMYVIPPNRDLSILHGVLHLFEPAEPRGLRLPIDYFLRSLAADQQANSIAVILSGMGSDGSLGSRAIKESGGAVFVQDPESAKFDGMPRSAIDAGLADVIAPADELASRILAYRRHAPLLVSPPELSLSDADGSALEKIVVILRAQSGHDFSFYKKSTLYRRIERRMGLHQLASIADYVRYVRDNIHEAQLLFKELLIGVTSFFRDTPVWEQIEADVFPALLAGPPPRPPGGGGPPPGGPAQDRIGGAEGSPPPPPPPGGATAPAPRLPPRAGAPPPRPPVGGGPPACSTGEEAYSLAIAFRDTLERLKPEARFTLQIFATDLDSDAIDRARAGEFPGTIASDVSEARLRRYFIQHNGGFRVCKEIREMVTFAPQNLVMDPPFTKLDLLTCRNLLIYLEADLQKKLLPLFHYSLRPGGLLVLGSAETVGAASDLFAAWPGKTRIYQRRESSPRTELVDFPASIYGRSRKGLAAPVPAAGAAQSGSASVQTLIDSLLQQRFSPAAVLTTDKGDIIYISGKTGKYLEPAVGKANLNIFAMAREGLSGALNEVFARVVREQGSQVLKGLRVGGNDGALMVNVEVHSLQEPAPLSGMVLIVFSDQPAARAKPPRKGQLAGAEAERMDAMAQEMQQSRGELQRAREEMQTSQEELKSTNEELQSTNEELQSTNEELTTSKEEMQSMNEELQTVNHELSAKLDELSQASDDMKNLLNSTDIATLFLDEQMCIRRFTNRITGIFKLIPGDAGRPITDLVSTLNYPALAEDAREVLSSLVFREVQVSALDGRWFTVRIMPYRTQDNRIDGVVITFIDISSSKTLERALRLSDERFRIAIEHAPLTVFSQDHELRYTWVHNLQPQLRSGDAIGKTDADLLPPDDAARLTQLKRQALEQGLSVHTETTALLHGTTHYYDFYAEPARDHHGAIIGVSGMAWEITEQKRSESRFRQLLEHSLNAVACHQVILDDGVARDFLVLEVNPKFMEMTGLRDVVGKRQSELATSVYPFNPDLFAACARVATTRKPERMEVSARDGAQWINCSLYSPEPGYFILVKEDITERKRMEDTLRQTLSLLQRGTAIPSSQTGAARDLEQVVRDAQALLEGSMAKHTGGPGTAVSDAGINRKKQS